MVSGGIFNGDGLDIPELIKYVESNKVVKNFPGTTAITNEELFQLDVDILAPCALDGVIHEKNADGIKAKIIIEGANGPTSIEGDRILEEKGCIVVPDILANGGGVVVSYFEWVQDVQNYFWDEPQIDKNMQKILNRAFNKVYQFSKSEKVSMRAAAMAVSVKHLEKAMLLRGLYPR